jgi:hypothetical protein
MATDFLDRSDAIEECYEYLLGYAGKGLPSDEGGEIRRFLDRAAGALRGLEKSCAEALTQAGIGSLDKYQSFLAVLNRDAGDSLAAIEMVLAQPAISSQLIDNLNASIHLRALLTDLFLVGEVLSARTAMIVGDS